MGTSPFVDSLRLLPYPEKLSLVAHSAFLLLLALPLFSCSDRASPDPGRKVLLGPRFMTVVACCVYVLSLQLLVLCYEAVNLLRLDNGGAKSSDYSVLYLPFVQALCWAVLVLWVSRCKLKVLGSFPVLVRLWWVVSFCLCIFIGYSDTKGLVMGKPCVVNPHLIANYASVLPLAFLLVVALGGVTGVELCREEGDLRERLISDDDAPEEEEEAGCLKVSPYSNAGFFSLMTLSWLNPLLSIGVKRPLELRDIPLLAKKDRSKTCYKILNSNWERLRAENPAKQPSLAVAIFRSFWKEAALNAVFAGVNTLVSYVGPYLISYFVDYLSGNETFAHEGYILAAIFFSAKLIETLTSRQWYVGVDILGMHVRSALTAMVYRKGLRLSSLARQCHTSGEIVNYMAVDVKRVGDYSWYLHDIWMLPLQIVLALAILYKNVGVAAVATLIATIVSIVVTIPLAKMQEEYQDNLMSAKDDRMRKTSECLRNMRILKLQAWEDRYRLKLEEMRNVEFKWLRKALYSQAFITFIFWGSPIFVSVITFGTSILLGHMLTAGSVLSALATFRILQEPLRNFPDLVSMIAQTKVSVDRISGFLQDEELQEDATIVVPQGHTTSAVEIKDGEFCWDPYSSRYTLSAIQLKVDRGMRVAVCGVVGSGKSSLLSCILGQIPKVSGEVRISGSVAYVSQSAWIQSGNIEENILFGSPMDKQRYKAALHACSLKKDLELLSHRDQTIIGDRGINLSGGQKQRIQLARALYQDADIYLLDDPFSAVDAHTGSDLFKEYILTALASKTVVYVTHQVEFLPAADMILVLKEGHIIQAGRYEELLQAGTDFDALVSAHHEAIEAMDILDYGSDDLDVTGTAHVDASSLSSRLTSSVSNADRLNEGKLEKKEPRKEKKKDKRVRTKQLVQEEERERGKISFRIYLSYMAAAYKGMLIPLIILAQAAFQVLQIASNWWMAWANPQTKGDKPKASSTTLLVVYMILAFGSSWFVFVRAVLVATFGLAAAQKLFIKMLRTVFRAPMSFFDSTPAGRILNRVSVDQSVVDLDIPFRLGAFASTTIQLIGIVGVMSKVTWQVLLLLVPMAVACLWMQKYYMASSRELVRIVSIQKSPIIHLFGESIAGASTIRGFGQEKRFMKRNLYLLDCFSRPFFCSLAAIEWLCLRMELLSTFVFAFCMILLVSFPHGTIDPSMAGLAVTYGLNLNARLSRWILSFCKLENKIISIERIHQYCQIPSEARSRTTAEAFRKLLGEVWEKRNRGRKRMDDHHEEDGSCGCMSLREWVDRPGREVDRLECLHVFRQVVDSFAVAQAQGAAVANARPSCFVVSSCSRVSFIESACCSSDSDADAEADEDKESSDQNDGGDGSNTKAFPMKQILALEYEWYASPEEGAGGAATVASDIYRLGVLLFEIFCTFESPEEKVRSMSSLRHRVLPPVLLLQWPKEASFCLWLLHPQPEARPTMSEVLQSEFLNETKNILEEREAAIKLKEKIEEQELLLDFLLLLQEKKEETADKLHDTICFLLADIREVLNQQSNMKIKVSSSGWDKDTVVDKVSKPPLCPTVDEDSSCSGSRKRSRTGVQSNEEKHSEVLSEGRMSEISPELHESLLLKSSRLMKNFKSMEVAYFSTRRRQMKQEDKPMDGYYPVTPATSTGRGSGDRTEGSSVDCLTSKEGHSIGRNHEWINPFLEGLCKYLSFSQLKVRADLKQGDLLSSSNLVCSLDFDRDKELFATGGVNRKIKIFECDMVLNEDHDIHYPVVEMATRSRISCICWNSYIKSQLASSDFEGVVQVWDVTRGQVFLQMREHERRVWSVDFSPVDPTSLASGSDDGSVKLWNINQAGSVGTIKTKANVCTVQFPPDSAQTITIGSADHNVYCYDLRNSKEPLCSLTGHAKTVSYVKYIDASTIVSASTDSTLKLWDISVGSSRVIDDPVRTFTGHANLKNFVGLSICDGYIATGSETNEVFVYHKSFPMPVLSYKFGVVDPISGREVEDNTHFISCVRWRGQSPTLLAANSTGNIKLLEMV